MNLQEALDYRTTCILCDYNEFKISSGLKDSNTILSDNNLHVERGDASITFKFDGSFSRHKLRKNSFVPLRFYKWCVKCAPPEDSQKEYGKAGILDIVQKHYYYSFDVLADVQSKQFIAALNVESVSLENDGSVFHLETSHLLKESILNYAQMTDSIIDLNWNKVPYVNLSAIKSKDQLVDKIRLFSVFS